MDRMSGSKHGIFFFLLIFFCVSNSFKLCFCPEIEKQALLKFKQSLKDPDNMLSSWNVSSEDNCCMWSGVVCSNLTGHVHQLRLQFKGLHSELSPSLVNLKELKYLDLSGNYFGIVIPSFIGQITSLEYLNLSSAAFYGMIPHSIGNLSNLRTLTLEDDSSWFLLNVDSMEWLSGLHRLEYLNMNGVNLSKAANWVQVINTLPSLLHLHLRSCSLNSLPPVFTHLNTTSLTTLDLSQNNFESFVMPTWIFQQPNLIFLDLSDCSLEGPIPTFSNITKLKNIDLSRNNINSSIPDWLYFNKNLQHVKMGNNTLHNTISSAIGNLTSLNILSLSSNQLSGNIPKEIASLCKMQELDLSENNLQGDVSDSFGNMSECFLESVTHLYLSQNQLSGHLTNQFGEFKSLEILHLDGNSISDTIPINIGKLSSLQFLRLDRNKLTGNLPVSLGQLHNLIYLNIAYNMLEGIVIVH